MNRLSLKEEGLLLSRITSKRGTHMPLLSQFVPKTTGPILELGCGLSSTPFFHWLCLPTKRRLVTVENDPNFFTFLKGWDADFHEIICTTDLDSLDFSGPWGVVFVDHSPADRRVVDIKRVAHADYVIVHDSENRSRGKYHYYTIYNLFPYRYHYSIRFPSTSILSNKHELDDLELI